jgi:hypothetical protein
MAICHEMKEGDLYFCELCGLELKVEKPAAVEPKRVGVPFPFNAAGRI